MLERQDFFFSAEISYEGMSGNASVFQEIVEEKRFQI